MRSFPHRQFPLLTQAAQQVSILATNTLQKLLSSYAVVEALYTYQTPFNHQIKGVAAASVESGGPARKVKGECETLTAYKPA